MQGALQFRDLPQPPSRLKFLAGLDIAAASFVRLAAARISALDTASAIDTALKEVPIGNARFVESLVVAGLALRVARAPAGRIRELLLAEVPEFMLVRVAPLAKSYAVVKPWERKDE